MPKLFVPTPGAIEVTWEVFAYDSKNTCNVVHFQNQNPPTTQLQVDFVIGQLSAWFALNVMPWMSVDWLYDTATCRPLDSYPPTLTVDQQFAVGGGQAGRALPNNCALRIETRGAGPGKAVKGNRKIGGIPESFVVGNHVSEAYRLFVEAAWASLIPVADGLGWTWCVLSKVEGGIARTTGLMTPITDVFVLDTKLDSCRSRMRGVI